MKLSTSLNNKIFLIVFAIFSSLLPSDENINLFEGYWITSGSIVFVKECNKQLCAFIEEVTIEDKDGFKLKVDSNNRNKSLRKRPLIGINLLQDFPYPDPNRKVLRNGKIYDPGRGRVFKSNLYILDNGNLKVEGCFLGICGHEEWSRLK
tara:strand:- start:303 stop:752 length:450 start_codon:yes stop_codon:yes gene_type:complete